MHYRPSHSRAPIPGKTKFKVKSGGRMEMDKPFQLRYAPQRASQPTLGFIKCGNCEHHDVRWVREDILAGLEWMTCGVCFNRVKFFTPKGYLVQRILRVHGVKLTPAEARDKLGA